MSQAAPVPPPNAPSGGADDASNETLPRKFGKYTLLRRIAAGGMAELFLALHRSMAGFEKLVVIKRILPEMSRDQGFITMLLQEARIAATFSHPNIVTIFDVGQVEGTYFIAMEHIHGEDLRSIVRAMKPAGVTEFPLEHAIAIALGVSAGLAYAHERTDLSGNPLNIVHRDVSPQNVLVTFSGDVKVVDFGIAKASRSARDESPEAILRAPTRASSPPGSSSHNTRVGQLKGKVPYMSPEQARGDALDGRSDIFALGVVLFELCTGRRLFRGADDLETITMITEGEYPRAMAVNPRIPAALDAVIMRALSKRVEDRYQNAREMQAELEEVVRQERIAVSTLSLAKWLEKLFGDKLAAQREALLQGKQLADVLAADQPEETTSTSTTGGALPFDSLTRAPATHAPTSGRGIAIALGTLAVVALASAGGALWFKNRQSAAQAADHSGAIAVTSVPTGASIWLNDAPTPYRTPHTFTGLSTGPGARFTVRVTAEGYAPQARSVELATRNARQTVDASLVRAQADSFAVLEVRSTPSGATVLIDGRSVPGVTPVTVPELQPGVEHTIVVRHPDALDETFVFTGERGRLERRDLVLRERPLSGDEAWVTVSTVPENATVRVGDRAYTGSPFRMRVNARAPVALEVTAPGYETERRPVRVRAGQTVAVRTITLERPRAAAQPAAPVDRRPGSMRIGATPWCNITVDGRARGQTPVDIASISAGSHPVVCTNPARGTQTQRITVQPGQQAVVRFRFP